MEERKKLIPEKVIGFKFGPVDFKVTPTNTITYALGIGFNEDQLNQKEFKFTYEMSDNFSVFPTYASVIPLNDIGKIIGSCPGIPDFNPMGALHGEQWTEFLRPIPNDVDLEFNAEIIDLEDKGKGTALATQINISSKKDKTLYAVLKQITFVKGLKGEGYKSKGFLKNFILPKIPQNQKPIKEVTFKTNKNQALIYRLGGNDANPLHVDPNMSILGGFETPILHGLCFYGITGKAAYDSFCDDDIGKFSFLNARFTSHVFPGETLIVQFFKGENGRLLVSTKTKERGLTVLTGEVGIKNPKF